MKFSQLSAFEKHLEKAAPDHLSEVYLIVDPEPYMQRKLALKVLQDKEAQEILSAENLTVGQLKQALEMRSLFEARKCCFVLGIEKLPKPTLDALLKAIQNPHPQIRLVLTASQMTSACHKMVKTIVTLDLSGEKPWDRERRLADYVSAKLNKASLFIAPALAEQVVKKAGSQMAMIDQELEKLICFLKEKKEVKREDLTILQSNFQYSIFKIGEALLENKLGEALKMIHLQTFPTILLLYSLRNLFQRGLRLKELPREQIPSFFPMLKGRLLEKNLKLVQPFSSKHLKKALLTLFEMEVKMKNQKIPEDFLQSLLLLKLGAPDESLQV